MKRILNKANLLIFFIVIAGLSSFTSDKNEQKPDSQYILQDNVEVNNNDDEKTLALYEGVTSFETDKKQRQSYHVTITMYEPLEGQTDDSPNITADGTKFEIAKASKYRYVALSRNILSHWGGSIKYGDFIEIVGAGDKSGVYQVKDTMHPRFINYVDILETPGSALYKFNNAILTKYQPVN